MKKLPALLLPALACAGLLVATTSPGLAGDTPTPAPSPSPETQAPTPSPLSPQITAAPAAGTPVTAHPPENSVPVAPVPAPIPFNAQNKEVAKKIYLLTKEIQESEFNPEANMAVISKLQDTIAQSDFSGVPQIHDYIKDSLTLNTLRSRDIKIQRADVGKSSKQDGGKTGGSAGVGILSLVSGGASFEKNDNKSNETQNTSDVSISSQNDPAVLDKARHQQATSYGFTLNEMKRLGFARPIDVKMLLGRWKWRCNEDLATYEFEFRKDGTVYVRLKADNPERWVGHGFVNKGRGEWKLDYRSLSLEMNDVNLAGFWKQHPLIFFAGKEIVSIDDEKMLIASDEDNELKKISEEKK